MPSYSQRVDTRSPNKVARGSGDGLASTIGEETLGQAIKTCPSPKVGRVPSPTVRALICTRGLYKQELHSQAPEKQTGVAQLNATQSGPVASVQLSTMDKVTDRPQPQNRNQRKLLCHRLLKNLNARRSGLIHMLPSLQR